MLDASTAGAKAGRAVVLYESDGTGTSVLPITELATQSIEILAQVNHFANSSLSLANDVARSHERVKTSCSIWAVCCWRNHPRSLSWS